MDATLRDVLRMAAYSRLSAASRHKAEKSAAIGNSIRTADPEWSMRCHDDADRYWRINRYLARRAEREGVFA